MRRSWRSRWQHLRWDVWPWLSYVVFDGCERCGSWWKVKWEPGRTAYHFTGTPNSPDDPNRCRRFCRPCAAEYHEHWDDMWSQVYAGY